ncbi:type II toxin-antitoxin system VapB family antitoxin [Glycomyces tenuis]
MSVTQIDLDDEVLGKAMSLMGTTTSRTPSTRPYAST